MNHTLDKIKSNPCDYKVCKECNNINWYENKSCQFCYSDLTNIRVIEKSTSKWINSEIDFYIDMNYSIDEVYNVSIEV
jgi:ribosomal protein L40E